jgi:hypothetical protein
MGQQIVKGGADLEKSSRTSFCDNLLGNLFNEGFPVGRRDMRRL